MGCVHFLCKAFSMLMFIQTESSVGSLIWLFVFIKNCWFLWIDFVSLLLKFCIACSFSSVIFKFLRETTVSSAKSFHKSKSKAIWKWQKEAG